jgi:phospholipid/cholesterol/gamma-HCH transport system substrate-binding protein
MKSVNERSPAAMGVVSVTVLALILVLTYFYEDLPIVGGGTRYTAEFSEIAGLRVSDEVRIAGVRVGKVTDMELAGDKVDVTFRVDHAWVGERSSVSIQIKTLLGQKYLALDPQGSAPLDPDRKIPKERTLSPYDITEAFNGLSRTVDQVDTQQLSKSFTVISDSLKNSAPEIKSTLDGLSALSETVGKRDEQLANLLGQTRKVSQTLADRDKEFEKLLGDGNLVLSELQARKAAISRLLTGTRNLSLQIQGLVADNSAQLRPALEKLDRVSTVLQRNQDDIGRGLQNLAPFYRVFTNTFGNGRWLDVYVCGLLPPGVDLNLLNINPEGCLPPKANSGTAGGPR